MDYKFRFADYIFYIMIIITWILMLISENSLSENQKVLNNNLKLIVTQNAFIINAIESELLNQNKIYEINMDMDSTIVQ